MLRVLDEDKVAPRLSSLSLPTSYWNGEMTTRMLVIPPHPIPMLLLLCRLRVVRRHRGLDNRTPPLLDINRLPF